MKGLDCQEAKLSELERTKRIDSEYFDKRHIRTIEYLKNGVTMSAVQCAKISDGNHFSISDDFAQSGIPYYRGQDVVGHFFVEQADPIYITDKAYRQPWMSRSHLLKGDVLLSIVGTIGELSIVSEASPATCSCKLAILRPNDISPEYLATFLRCNHGRSQVERLTRGAVQMGVLLEDMDQLRVIRLSSRLEAQITQQVKAAKAAFEDAKTGFAAAESVFPTLLGLGDWEAPSELACVRRFSDVYKRERIDAEHYREEFYAATRSLKGAGILDFVTMEELVTVLTNGHTPLHHDLEVGEIPFLCAEHVSNFEVNFRSEKRILLQQHKTELMRTALQEDDILLTIKGRVGNAALVENLPGMANINQDVALLRLNTKVPTWYVLSFINSVFGKLQVLQLSTGGINPFLGLSNVRKLQIPRLNKGLMKEIATETKALVHAARQNRENALHRLRTAKLAIEIAIEQGEANAIRHLNQEAR